MERQDGGRSGGLWISCHRMSPSLMYNLRPRRTRNSESVYKNCAGFLPFFNGTNTATMSARPSYPRSTSRTYSPGAVCRGLRLPTPPGSRPPGCACIGLATGYFAKMRPRPPCAFRPLASTRTLHSMGELLLLLGGPTPVLESPGLVTKVRRQERSLTKSETAYNTRTLPLVVTAQVWCSHTNALQTC